eukprot:gene30987-37450_t
MSKGSEVSEDVSILLETTCEADSTEFSFDDSSDTREDTKQPVTLYSYRKEVELSVHVKGPPQQLSVQDLRKTRRNPFPRILKRDVRLIMPQMFVNVANSCDSALLSRFFTDLCLPHCQFFDYAKHPVTCEKHQLLNNNGVQNFLNFLGAGSPPPVDFACSLKGFRIKRLPYNTNSLVIATLLIRGTDLIGTFFSSHCDNEHRKEADEIIAICRDMCNKSSLDMHNIALKGVAAKK